MFLRPTCVQAQFTSDDQQLATLWYQAGVPGETFRRAWLLGCVRKSMTLINHPATQPIRSLRYFVPLLQEVQQEPILLAAQADSPLSSILSAVRTTGPSSKIPYRTVLTHFWSRQTPPRRMSPPPNQLQKEP